MKDAILWKRILNEGLWEEGSSTEEGKSWQNSGYALTGEQIVQKIITSPIIVDRAERQPDGEFDPLNRWIGMPFAFPFKLFWIEFPKVDNWLSGSLIWQSEPVTDASPEAANQLGEGSIQAMFMNVLAFDGRRPILRAPTYLHFTKDHKLVDDHHTDSCDPMTFAQCEFVLSALTVIACKNVSLSPRDNDPKQVRRAIKRHGNRDHGYRYHVLVVRPPGAKSDSPAQEIGIMPRHVCRGHFAEYGPEFNKGLLFGKYAGRFYVPPHLKGDKKNGEVAKDYAIPAS